MCSRRFYLWEQIHDPVSVTWIAFNGKLMGFRKKIFKKQFVCLLFSVCSFIALVENMIVRQHRSLITRITSAKMSAIMFSTNVMDEQTENNKQTNCFLKIFIRKPISLPLKGIHVTLTGSSGFVSTSKIGWAHGKFNICLRSGAFPNLSWTLYEKFIKRLWNIYKYINFLSISCFPWA